MTSIPVRFGGSIILGKIASIEVVELEFGERINVQIQQPNSDAVRYIGFKLRDTRKSAWGRFVRSFNKVMGKEITRVEDMISAWVKIEEVTKSAVFPDGREAEWDEYLVIKTFPNEVACAEELFGAAGDEEDIPFAPEPKPEVPEALIIFLKGELAKKGQAFWADAAKSSWFGFNESDIRKVIA